MEKKYLICSIDNGGSWTSAYTTRKKDNTGYDMENVSKFGTHATKREADDFAAQALIKSGARREDIDIRDEYGFD